ncbi:MAG: hypothetical protein WKG07_34410, partial [Hymenobacter sp.]
MSVVPLERLKAFYSAQKGHFLPSARSLPERGWLLKKATTSRPAPTASPSGPSKSASGHPLLLINPRHTSFYFRSEVQMP